MSNENTIALIGIDRMKYSRNIAGDSSLFSSFRLFI